MQVLQRFGLASLLLFLSACGSEAPEPAPGVTLPLEMPAVLDNFASTYDAEIWLRRQATLESPGLEAGLHDLDEAVRAEALQGFKEARILTLIERAQSNHMVIVTLLKWDSHAAALRYVDAERLAMAAKDGNQGVESAEYRDVMKDDLTGFISDKELRDMFGPYGAKSAVVARGATLVEVTILAEVVTDDALLEKARGLLGALGVPAP